MPHDPTDSQGQGTTPDQIPVRPSPDWSSQRDAAPKRPAASQRHSRTSEHEGEPDQIRGYYSTALRAVTGHQYLLRKWLPLKGPSFYALVQVLRSYCFADPHTGEQRNTCFPEAETLATRCGLSRRTVFYLLKDPDMARFVKRIPRRRYSPEHQRDVQTSNQYLVSLDDPPIPDDDSLVEEKAAELAALEALATAEASKLTAREQARYARRHKITQAQDTLAAASSSCPHGDDPSECKICTPRAVQDLHSQRGAKSALEIDTLKERPLKEEIHRSGTKRTPAAPGAPGGPHIAVAYTATGKGRSDDGPSRPAPHHPHQPQHSAETGTNPDRIESSHTQNWAKTPPQGDGSKEQHEWERSMERVHAAAGGIVYDLLEEMGATNPAQGVHMIVQAMVTANAPEDRLVDLAYFARARVQRFIYRGGRVDNVPGYYITVMRSLLQEAPRYGWDTELMERRDQVKHERAIAKANARSRTPR